MALITVIGTLGRDADLSFTASGQAMAKVGLAENRRYQKDGEWVEETCWHNLVVWGQMGENFAQTCYKGTRVIAQGRLVNRTYEKDGETKYITEIVVDAIGPELRWSTAIVEKTERTDGEAPKKAAPKKKSSYDDDSDAPF